MITGELKNKIDSLWDIFAAGGLTNPLEVIEQITYLMFIRDLDDVDNKNAKENAILGYPLKVFSQNKFKLVKGQLMGINLNGQFFMIFLPARCMRLCKIGFFLLLRIYMLIRTVRIQNTWMMRYLNYQLL